MNGNSVLAIVHICIQSDAVDVATFTIKNYVNEENKIGQIYFTTNTTVDQNHLWLAQFYVS